MENQLYLMIISFALVFLLLCLIYHTKKLRRQMELLHNEKEVLNEISNEDPLTGIYNRRGFDQAAASVLARSSAAVVGLIDVNDFKRFNDVYGHAAGDVVLKEIAHEISELAKHYQGICGRNGGDEFVLLLPGNVIELDVRLQKWANVRRGAFGGRAWLAFSLSLGYAYYPRHANELSQLVSKADLATYYAKMHPENHACRYNALMTEARRTQLGFSLKDMLSGVPGGVLITEADDMGRILLANQELAHLFECDDPESFVGMRQVDTIYPDDWEKLNRVIQEHMEDSPELEEHSIARYRIVTRRGNLREVISLGKRFHHEQYGDIFYIIVYDAEELRRV